MTTADMLLILGMALGLGLLVGMQRERSSSRIAGIRTFALITLLGAVVGLLASTVGGWLVGAAMLGLVLFAGVGNLITARQEVHRPGITTEVTILLMFCVGVMLVQLPREIPLIITGVITILLQLKVHLHGFIRGFSERDVRAIMTFVLVALVILPVVPNRSYGPYGALNPYEIWGMVVLVVAMSFAGYVAYRIIGERGSILLGGILGGLVSSTATTVSYSRRAAAANSVATATAVIMITSGVVYPRLLIEIQIAASGFVGSAIGPLAIMFAASVLLAALTYFVARPDREPMPEQANPTELKSALFFGALYAGVLLAVAVGRDLLGDSALYGIAAISGLTDMDAITLSSARLAAAGTLAPQAAWRAIIIAAMSNLAFKCGLVLLLGGGRLFLRVGILFAVKLAVGGALLAFWR